MAGILAGVGRGNAEPHALFMGTLAIYGNSSYTYSHYILS